MSFETNQISKCGIVKVEGRPNSPDRPKERTRWRCFKEWLFPHLKKSEELTQAYAEAKVQQEKSEARKTTEEAAEIAARKDLEIERKRILDQKEIQEFNSAVDNIFLDDGLPEAAKALKFAKLMEKNPEVVAQLDKVRDVAHKLALTRGVGIETVDNSEKSLLEEQDFGTGQEAVPDRMPEVAAEEAIDEELTRRCAIPIQELELSVRAHKCLESVKVETIGQLVQVTDADLLKIRGLGKASLREIKRKLADIGLSLGMVVQ